MQQVCGSMQLLPVSRLQAEGTSQEAEALSALLVSALPLWKQKHKEVLPISGF